MNPDLSNMNYSINPSSHKTTGTKQETTSCSRCGGYLVSDRCYDLLTSGVFKIEIQRCVQCGDVIDPMILRHRWQSRMN